MKRFAWIVANSVSVSFDCNNHRNCYRTAAEEFEDSASDFSDMDDAERGECASANQICVLQGLPEHARRVLRDHAR